MQNYFTKILEDDLKALIKPQYVDQIPKAIKGTVRQLLDKKNELENMGVICDMLGEYSPNAFSIKSNWLIKLFLLVY